MEGTADVGKHLLDETAEFRLPKIARHAAEDEVELDQTQRFEADFRQLPAPLPDPNAR